MYGLESSWKDDLTPFFKTKNDTNVLLYRFCLHFDNSHITQIIYDRTTTLGLIGFLSPNFVFETRLVHM